MPHEKQIDKEGWIARLQALDAVPGENHPGTNPLWERLHAKLGKKKKQNGAIWYWSAAASVIIVLRVFFVSDIKEDHAITVQNTGKKQQPAIEKVNDQSAFPAANNTSAAVIPPVKTEKNKHKRILSPAPVKIEKEVNAPLLPSMVIIPKPDSVQINIVATTVQPPKKKMRVVHINRLENYIEQKETKDYFTTNAKDGLIKIKLSPSN